MKTFVLTVSLLFASFIFAQNKTIDKIQKFQEELNQYYKDSNTTPLPGESYKSFQGHDFFPIDTNYRVQAKFIRTKKAKVFEMPTSGKRTPEYKKYGEAHFKIEGKDCVLEIYQNQSHKKNPKYKNLLFLPFNDQTNGETSYVGGRYLDLVIPENDQIVLDFNQAYNPLCAYNPTKYSCPIPPEANILKVNIPAGVKFNQKDH